MTVSSHFVQVFAIVFSFIGGAAIGSFINAAAMRTVAGKKWWGKERSICDRCGQPLSPLDLIPLFSYLFLRGRCRYCGERIVRRHFVVELVCALATTALYLRWGLTPALAISLTVLWFCIFNSLTDLESGYIFDLWAVTPGVFGLLIRLAGDWPAVLDGFLGALLGFAFIALIILLSRGGMGWGDAMLMLGIGGALGWRYCALSLYAGFFVGGITVLPLLLAKKLNRKDAIPLGPFLAVGSVIVLFAGNRLLPFLSVFFGNHAGWPW